MREAVGGGVPFLVSGIAQHPSLQETVTVSEIASLNVPAESIDRIEIIRGRIGLKLGIDTIPGLAKFAIRAGITSPGV